MSGLFKLLSYWTLLLYVVAFGGVEFTHPTLPRIMYRSGV